MAELTALGFGILTASILALAAVGFTVQFSVTNILNLAYGDVMTGVDYTLKKYPFADGSRMKNEFTNAVLNPVLDREVFAWKPEPSYKVTQPMKK